MFEKLQNLLFGYNNLPTLWNIGSCLSLPHTSKLWGVLFALSCFLLILREFFLLLPLAEVVGLVTLLFSL
jgi:hypothetical protein